ncbi:MAG: helix-turn-helix domain-containing protein [Candidatus Buchananbacteria bacterium]
MLILLCFVQTNLDKTVIFIINKYASMPNVIRVSVSEASRLFGVDTKTIRRAIQKQELKYIVVQGRYKINFESLLAWSQNRTTVNNKLASQGIGQYVEKWRIKNKLYSPSPALLKSDSPKNLKRNENEKI